MSEGLFARIIALDILQTIIRKKQNLDDSFENKAKDLPARDKAFIRMLITTTLRRMGQIDDILRKLLTKNLPQNTQQIEDILRLAMCQILFMETADFAAVNSAVEMTRHYKKEAFSSLVNGVLRNVCRRKEKLLNTQDAAILNTPQWLWTDWVKSYGKENTYKIALANLNEPSTYITCKKEANLWAEKLNGILTSTGSIQLPKNVYIPDLQGFNEGAWWVQDAAAHLAVQAFNNDLNGKYVADICAAPGGKTAGLIAKGAKVDAFDISKNRMERVKENLKRLNYTANLYVKDANDIDENKIYDAILLDAPCSATGTIMRHPDLYFHRTQQDIEKLNAAQYRLLQTAHKLLKDEGELVYCTCSLQTQEGEDMIDKVSDLFQRQEIKNPCLKPFLTTKGDIRTFPYNHMDGFFISLLKKRCK